MGIGVRAWLGGVSSRGELGVRGLGGGVMG
jgi:hypothetical protein